MRSTLWGIALLVTMAEAVKAQQPVIPTFGAYAGFHTSDDQQPVVGAELTLPLGSGFALEPSLGGALADPGYISAALQVKRLFPSGSITLYLGAGPSWTHRDGASRIDLAGTAGLQAPGLGIGPGLVPFAEVAITSRHYAAIEARGGFRVRLIHQ